MRKVSIVTVKDSLKLSIQRSISEIVPIDSLIRKGDAVLLKPNFNTADPFPGSTDPEFLRVVVEIMYEHGAGKVIIGDSSTFRLKTTTVMKDLGIDTFTEMDPAPELMDFNKHKRTIRQIPNGKYQSAVSVPEIFDQVDKIIYLPCLKTHFLAQYTGALKLSIGLMNRKDKISFHVSKLQEKIAELNTVLQPDLVIMDARKCFITGGPGTGEVRKPQKILCSTGRVAIDIEGVKIIQGFTGNSLGDIQPEELPQIRHAIEMGIS